VEFFFTLSRPFLAEAICNLIPTLEVNSTTIPLDSLEENCSKSGGIQFNDNAAQPAFAGTTSQGHQGATPEQEVA
jgi:hypothetical protein